MAIGPSNLATPKAAEHPAEGIDVAVQDDLEGRDLVEAMSILEAAYPRIDARIWQWQYASHYLGPPLVSVARVAGRVVGLQPSIRQDAWWKGARARSYQLCHVVTHPEFRRLGIFTALVGAIATHAEGEGSRYVYTFPNRLSYPGFRRIPSWEHPFSMPLMVRAGIGSGRPRRGLEGLSIERFDPGVDELGEAIAGRGLTGRIRDHRYLNWRYLEHPERPYVCLGIRDGSRWRALAVGRTVPWFGGVPMGAIVELLGDPDSLDPVLASLEEILVRRGALALGCLMLGGGPESDLLRRRGYRVVPTWAVRKEFYFVARVRGGLPQELGKPEAWWLTWADNDIV